MGNARSAALASAGEFLNGGRNDVACGGHGHGHIAVHHFDGILGVHALPLCLAHPVALGKQRLRTEEGIPGLHPLQISCFAGLSWRCGHYRELRHLHCGDQVAKALNHD